MNRKNIVLLNLLEEKIIITNELQLEMQKNNISFSQDEIINYNLFILLLISSNWDKIKIQEETNKFIENKIEETEETGEFIDEEIEDLDIDLPLTSKIVKNKKEKLGYLYMFFTQKSTIFHFLDENNKKHKQWSTKSLKKRESKKNTQYNIEILVDSLVTFLKEEKMTQIGLFLKGFSFGRRFVQKQLRKKLKKLNLPLLIVFMQDITPKPFNGCRLEKRKRK